MIMQKKHKAESSGSAKQEQEVVFVQCDHSHQSRLADYFPEIFGQWCSGSTLSCGATFGKGEADHTKAFCYFLPDGERQNRRKTKLRQELVVLSTSHRDTFLEQAFDDPFLYRCVKRYLVCQHLQKAHIVWSQTHACDGEDMQPSLSHSLRFLEDLAYSYAKENYVLRLQVFPGELLSSVVDILSPLVRLDPKSFTHVLSVVCISDNVIMTPSPPLADTVKEVKATEGEQAEQDRAERVSFYYGLVSRQQFWSVETAIHSIPMNRLTRAHFKLREALERMKEPLELPINIKKEYFHQRKSGEGGGVMVQQDWEKRFIAVDVGASPGGWTQYLSTFASLVIAVDPAALRINPLPPNVVHLQMKSEEAVPYIKQLVAAREQTEQPAQDREQQGIVIEKGATEDHHKDGEKKEVDANKNGNQVDLITCDMNQSAEIVAGILGDVVPLLRVGGHLVLTLKFPRRTEKNIKDKVEAIKAEFVAKFPDFDVLRVLWLLSNINERTLFAVKRENRAEGQTC